MVGFLERVMNAEFFNSRETKCSRQMFYYGLTYNADRSRNCYFVFNREVTKDRMYVDQFILKWHVLKFYCHKKCRAGQHDAVRWNNTTNFSFSVEVWTVVAALTGNDRLLVAVDFFESLADTKPEY